MAFPIINRRASSWGHLVITAGTIRSDGWTALEYSDDKEESLGRTMGMAAGPSLRSEGVYTPGQCKLTGYAGKVDAFLQQLSAIAPEPGNVSSIDFLLTATFAPRNGDPVRTIVLEETRILGISDSYADGPDLLMTDLKIQPLRIIRNGIRLWSALP